MVRHPIVRSRYEVKNGATTKEEEDASGAPRLEGDEVGEWEGDCKAEQRCRKPVLD